MENYSCNSVVRCIFIIIFVPFLLPTRNKDYSTNTEFIMAIAPNEATPQVDLIYKIEDKPSFKDAVFAAFQHLLAIFVAIITPPLIIAGALDLDLETTSFLVSMALFASGVSTFIQCRRVGPLGAGLLCVQGTSFSFIGPIISAGLAGGLPLIFGCTIAAAPVEMIVSRTFRYLKQIITWSC